MAKDQHSPSKQCRNRINLADDRDRDLGHDQLPERIRIVATAHVLNTANHAVPLRNGNAVALLTNKAFLSRKPDLHTHRENKTSERNMVAAGAPRGITSMVMVVVAVAVAAVMTVPARLTRRANRRCIDLVRDLLRRRFPGLDRHLHPLDLDPDHDRVRVRARKHDQWMQQ